MTAVAGLRWTGRPGDIEQSWFREFVAPGLLATPRLIWWIEPDLSGLADLLLTAEQAPGHPIRVRPFEWCHRVGGRYGLGRQP